MKKHEAAILRKMKTYAAQAIGFKSDMDYEAFSDDFKTINACIFNLSQIGELVGRLSDEFKEAASDTPWKKIRGMRNIIVHDYEGVQFNIVWDVLTSFLPQFIADVDALLQNVDA